MRLRLALEVELEEQPLRRRLMPRPAEQPRREGEELHLRPDAILVAAAAVEVVVDDCYVGRASDVERASACMRLRLLIGEPHVPPDEGRARIHIFLREDVGDGTLQQLQLGRVGRVRRVGPPPAVGDEDDVGVRRYVSQVHELPVSRSLFTQTAKIIWTAADGDWTARWPKVVNRMLHTAQGCIERRHAEEDAILLLN
eukprot:6212189-Pleurochrysis_carterae.AAC.6